MVKEEKIMTSEVITDDKVEVVVFTLKDTKTKRSEIYGVNVKQIQEIRNVEKITRLPKSPEFVKGIMNLRGQIITIIDVKQKLDFDTNDEENQNPSILISKINDQTLGFLIDDVDEVVRIDAKDIDRNTLENSDSASYLQGFVKTKDRLIILLDLEELILNTKINSEDVK
jgi:purine-binding chemotaxis protein CheW